MPAPGYLVLTEDQVRVLNSVEGNSVGSGQLSRVLDDALAAQKVPDGAIAQAKVTGLVTALAGKLTATPAANVAALGAYAAVTGVDGTGSNAASKADVDARFTAVYAKIDAEIAALKAAGIQANA